MLHLLVPVSLNDSLTHSKGGCRAPTKIKRMPNPTTITYGKLMELMSEKLASSPNAQQALGNLNSALRAFMEKLSITKNCAVGSTLRASYYRNLAAHVESLSAEGRNSNYIANRKCLIAKWRQLLLELDRQHAAENKQRTPLQAALRDILNHGFSVKRVAADAGVCLSSLRRWLNGASPNRKAYPSLRRLETFFGLHAGALVDLCTHDSGRPCDAAAGQAPPVEYRERLAKASRQPYALKDAAPSLRKEWSELVAHKVERLVLLERQAKGIWSMAKERETDSRWYCFHDHHYVPTAAVNWQHVSQYLGWLALDTQSGGVGIPREEVQTLTWLLATKLLQRYLKWRISKAGGVVHGGLRVFITFIHSLTHPRTGFLTQQPEWARSISLFAHPLGTTAWDDNCLAASSWTKKMQATLGGDYTESRNSFEALQSVLELGNPMDAVADMVGRMRADWPSTGGIAEAIWSRDLVLIKVLASNPLRAKNLATMTYSDDNTGNLYQRGDGSWHIRFPKRAFKNFRGAAKDRDYDMPVEQSMWRDIERYLKHYRPLLPHAKEVSYVFLSSTGHQSPGPWEKLNRRVGALTRSYLWRCPGVGPHAFRHICATAILKASPNDWQTAALVLHDQVATVEKHYAHLRSCDGAQRMQNLLASAFRRM